MTYVKETTVVELDGNQLNRENLKLIMDRKVKCEISKDAMLRVEESYNRVQERVSSGEVIYGVNTGFGKLSDVRIDDKDVEQLQINLLRADAVGVGDPLPTPVVRAMLVLRANALARGYSGIHPKTLQTLVDFINLGIHPVIPCKGSLGASGDLAPLSHMALVLIGEGRAEYQGEVLPGSKALARAGLSPVRLGPKEGLALINGTQAMTGVGVIALTEAEHLGLAADMAACLTMEALQGIISAFDPDLVATRPHKEQEMVASRIRKWLTGSKRVSEQGELRMQDAYSIRCIPQVHGASWQAVHYVDERLNIEMNATTDNPVVLDDGRILSGGQFHGQPIALSMDFLKTACAEWANISERRIERLVNPQLSGLSPFLANDPGLECGLMIPQYVAAALVSENKVLAHPACVDSIPSSANQEDHVSMGTIAARQVREMINNAAHVIAIEMICASQAIFLQQAEEDLAPLTRQHLEWVREIIQPITQDTSIHEQIEQLAKKILAEPTL
ncbi:histidine ammonia-lyase [Scopulibacillus cellulosilyticus]|uniref:Histidine ammonia-lyase n=1 Tax=Scopulibacillus cellulosilyticus TaxID=2665665 RepID=A0ABW2PPW2_9BACL